jgi:quaternary ammonium compound-resistance protein SugE
MRLDLLGMDWFILFIAGLLEIGWAVGLKLTDGFTKPLPSVLTVLAMVASVVLLAQATKTIPLGTAYAIWTGIGAVGVAIVGMVAFAEPRSAIRIACIFLVVVGIVGLKMFGGAAK